MPGVEKVEQMPDYNPGFDIRVHLKNRPPVLVEVKQALNLLSSAEVRVAVRHGESINQQAHIFVLATQDGVAIIPGDRFRAYVRLAMLEEAHRKVQSFKTEMREAKAGQNIARYNAAYQRWKQFFKVEANRFDKRRVINVPIHHLVDVQWALWRPYSDQQGRRAVEKPAHFP